MNNKKGSTVKTAQKVKRDYDILNMLNSISNFEVFTPFEITNLMINLLPEDVFTHPEYKFLDPCVKSGIFLREIIYKLNKNLPKITYKDKESNIEYDLNDEIQRINHILRNMIYGIAISELTSYVTRRTIYGVMEANVDKIDEYLNSKIKVNEIERRENKEDRDIENIYFNKYYNHKMFNTSDRIGFEKEGNIFYPLKETTTKTEDIHYPFINKTEHKIINNIKEGKMKFDVIIGNPPYQKLDGGNKSSAIPLYHLFIEEAIKLKPKYISMITPSRWMNGGKGLDEFRKKMQKDRRLKIIEDSFNAEKFFPNVKIRGGVNYFLWHRDYNGKCNFNGTLRYLDEYSKIIRNDISLFIIEKIMKKKLDFFIDKVSSRSPFGFSTNFQDYKKKAINEFSIKIYGNKRLMKETNGIGYVSKKQINKNKNLLGKHKIIIPYTGDPNENGKILSKPFYSEPNSVCSETYLILDICDNKKQAENLINYVKTKFFRFMVSTIKNTQHATRQVYEFVPYLDMSKRWTKEEIYSFFDLTQKEINYIEKSIKQMD